MPRARVLAVIVGLVALAVAVAIWSIRAPAAEREESRSTGETTAGADQLRGPDIPPKGALPGRLWTVVPTRSARGTACQLRAVDLGALELEPPGELTHCTLVDVSADGRYAVAYDGQLSLSLLDLRDRPQQSAVLASSFRDNASRTSRIAALAADGTRVAWCVAPNETIALSIESGETERLVGCDPRFGVDGEVFTRTVAPLVEGVRVDGEVVLDNPDFREGLDLTADEESYLLAYDVGRDGSVATKVRRVLGTPRPTIQVWQGGELKGFHRVSGLAPPLQASGVELSPDATRVALGWPGVLAGVLDFGFDRMSRTLDHGSYAWSPDGRWLAIGEAQRIAIYARGSEAPTYVLPLATLMLAWSD